MNDFELDVKAAEAVGPTEVLDLWRKRQASGRPSQEESVVVAESLIRMARPSEALEVLNEAGQDLRVKQLRALALAKSGDGDAIRVLVQLRESGERDAETGGLLGGRLKQRARSSGSRADLQAAYQVYVETWEETGDTYPGINAASLALVLDEPDESKAIAAEVLKKLDDLPPAQMDVWKYATRGEAHLLLDDLTAARKWYRRAVGSDPNAVQSIATMRTQARANLAALGHDEHELDEVLEVRAVVAFAGHMIDAPDRPEPRFPAEKEGEVRLAIRARLKELGVGFGFSSAARGADLLFLEELLERGGRAQVFLPFDREAFVESSVGEQWRDRFERVLADPRVTMTVLSDVPPPDADREVAFRSATVEARAAALQFAKQLGEEPVLLAVWNEDADDESGTAHAVLDWRGTGHSVESIPILTRAATHAPSAAPSPGPAKVAVKTRDIVRKETAPTPKSGFDYMARHCLCIGIKEYVHSAWNKLDNARNDAEVVGRVLADHHGFEPLFLIDEEATADGIAAKIQTDLRTRAGEDDLVVVFFAGHGHTKHMGGQEHGFIVPVEAQGEAPDQLISISQLTDWSAYLDSRHVLYIFDSCFSGMFQRMSGGDRLTPDVDRARIAVTAGQADQPVFDGGADTNHSVFTDSLILALREGVGTDEDFTVTELYSFLRRKVIKRFPQQTPTLATMKNHEGGEILFKAVAR